MQQETDNILSTIVYQGLGFCKIKKPKPVKTTRLHIFLSYCNFNKSWLIHKLYNLIRYSEYYIILHTSSSKELTCKNIFEMFNKVKKQKKYDFSTYFKHCTDKNTDVTDKIVIFANDYYSRNILYKLEKIYDIKMFVKHNINETVYLTDDNVCMIEGQPKFWKQTFTELFPVNKDCTSIVLELTKLTESVSIKSTLSLLQISKIIYECLDESLESLELYERLIDVVNELYKTDDKQIKRYCNMIFNKLNEMSNTVIHNTLESVPSVSKVDKFIEFAQKTIKSSTVILNRRSNEQIKQNLKLLEDLKNIPEITVDNVEDLERSRELFISPISLSDWVDEVESGSCIGLLVNIKTKPKVKEGYCKHYAFSITTTFMPIEDYIDSVEIHFKNRYMLKYGDLNKESVFKDKTIGTGNVVIPLYINKQHWLIAKKYMMLMLGIGFCHNPLLATQSHLKLLFSLFVNSLQNYTSINTTVSNRSVDCLFAFFRTCTEVAFENGYSKGIRKYVQLFLTDPKRRVFKSKYDYDIIIGQSLTSGFTLEDDVIKTVIKHFLEEVVRKCDILHKYTLKQLDECPDTVVNDVEKKIKVHLTVFKSYYLFNKLLRDIIICCTGSFNKLIKTLDVNGGLLPEEMYNDITSYMKQNRFDHTKTSFSDVYQMLGETEWKNETVLFCREGLKYPKNADKLASF